MRNDWTDTDLERPASLWGRAGFYLFVITFVLGSATAMWQAFEIVVHAVTRMIWAARSCWGTVQGSATA